MNRPSNVAAQWCTHRRAPGQGDRASHSMYPPTFSPSDRIVPFSWNENNSRLGTPAEYLAKAAQVGSMVQAEKVILASSAGCLSPSTRSACGPRSSMAPPWTPRRLARADRRGRPCRDGPTSRGTSTQAPRRTATRPPAACRSEPARSCRGGPSSPRRQGKRPRPPTPALAATATSTRSVRSAWTTPHHAKAPDSAGQHRPFRRPGRSPGPSYLA